MKRKLGFCIYIAFILLVSLSAILSGCSNSNENHGEKLKEMIKNDSQIQQITYGEPFYNGEDDGVECSEEVQNAIVDYISDMNITVTPKEEIELVFGGGVWLNFYLSDDKMVHLEFYGDNFYFYDSEECDGILYSDSTENYYQLTDYLFHKYNS